MTQYTRCSRRRGSISSFHRTQFSGSAEFATLVNERTENIGARRLHTVMEKLLDEISFEAPDMPEREFLVAGAYVETMLSDIVKNDDLSRYIL